MMTDRSFPVVVHVITGLAVGGAERALYSLLSKSASPETARVVTLSGRAALPQAPACDPHASLARSGSRRSTVNAAWNIGNFRKPLLKKLLSAGHRVTVRNLDREDGVRHLGRTEDRGSHFPFLKETLGRRIEIEHLNRTANSFQHRKDYAPEVRDVLARDYTADLERIDHDF